MFGERYRQIEEEQESIGSTSVIQYLMHRPIVHFCLSIE